jgi:hypothetical protein
VEVDLDGRTYHLEKIAPAGARTHVTSEVALGHAGVQVGEARLVAVEDALAADNRRAFVVDVHAAPTYLLVSRDPADPQPTSSHYLERALAPGAFSGVAGGDKVVRIAAAGIDQQALAAADAVVLDRPGRLDGPAVALLTNWLRRGKSILYVAGESADATNLGTIALQAGADMRMPVEFIPPPAAGAAPAAGTSARGSRRDLKLADVRRNDPVWSVFGDALQQTLDSLRFTARLTSRPLDGALADDLLASYSDRSACLISTACGQGTLIVWNADLAESNIVESGAFVPLVGELTARLLSSPPVAAAEGGEPLALTLPADVGNPEDLTVEPPAKDDAQKGRITSEQGGLVWRLDSAGMMGAYRIMHNGQLAAAVVVAIAPEESDLTPLSPDLLQGKLSGGRQITVHAAGTTDHGPDRAWVWLICLAALAMTGEFALLRAYRT